MSGAIENAERFAFIQELSDFLFQLQNCRLVAEDDLWLNNLESLKQLLFQNVDFLLQKPFTLIQFLFSNKGKTDQLFGMMSRRAKSPTQQTAYIAHCALLTRYLSELEQQEEKRPAHTIADFTAVQEQVSYLQEYSYIVYAAVLCNQFLVSQPQKSVLLRAQTVFMCAFPADLQVGQSTYIQQAIEAVKMFCAQISQPQQLDSADKLKIVKTAVICLSSLIMARPSEFGDFSLQICNFFGFRCDDLVLQELFQLYTASCIKIQRHLGAILDLVGENEVAREVVENLDAKILKQNLGLIQKKYAEAGLEFELDKAGEAEDEIVE